MKLDSEELNQQNSIKLTRNSKGYNWEIKLYGDDTEAILKELKELNTKLKAEYLLTE